MKLNFISFLATALIVLFFITQPVTTHAQFQPQVTVTQDQTATEDATPTATAAAQIKLEKGDITQPEAEKVKREVFALFAKRPATHPTILNITAYLVQYAVRIGIPANTVILILLLPLLATLVAFIRQVIGLPSLDMLVAISLSITLLAIGITAGFILLAAVILASTFGRLILKRIRIMQLPKMALSVFIVAIFVFLALIASGTYDLVSVKDLSIFPVLLLILLGERIVALQLQRNAYETTVITFVTLCIGVIGFFLLSFDALRQEILLYPEIIFLLIPLNIAIGRYFGLRLTEYFRFKDVIRHGSK